ncbi:MAG: hypothetical protein IPF57_16250 [Gammaproteobacteria bacterium]|nr:hypothetical protein [Gammaproteobacteria bacterium]
MFEQFPKTRPALPEEIARIYVSWYRENREGGSASKPIAAPRPWRSWLHRRVAADLRPGAATSIRWNSARATLNSSAGPPCGPTTSSSPLPSCSGTRPLSHACAASMPTSARLPAEARYVTGSPRARCSSTCAICRRCSRSCLRYSPRAAPSHLNTAREIEEVLRYFFGEVSMKVFGLSRGISLFQHFACAQPRRDRAHAYLHG